MEKTDNIDFMYTLESHGWSILLIYYDSRVHYFDISHSFSDPLTDLINLILNLRKGESSQSFDWYSEPGGHRFKFFRNSKSREKIAVVVEEILNEVFEEVTETKKVLEFEIKEKHLITVLIKQLEKTFELLKDPEFAKSREDDFPIELYKKLQEID